MLEDAEQLEEGAPSTSKSKGKTGDPQAQAEEGAEAPPEEIPPDPEPTDPQPCTSRDPPEASAEAPTKDPTPATQKPDNDPPPALTTYVRACRAAGKLWLDTVVDQGEKAYDTLYESLQWLGIKHKEKLDQANKE